MRRLYDLFVATLLLAVLAPLLVVIAIVLKLERSGPILYRRRCLGRHGKPFDMLRFRTMVNSSSHHDPEERLTPVGRFLRNYSLDEPPLLLNVVRGEMSIVGPRPTQPEFIDLTDPVWREILSVRPGVLSYAILRLARDYNRSSWPVRNRLELDYVRRRSLGFDLRLLGDALRALIASRGNHKARGEPTASPVEESGTGT